MAYVDIGNNRIYYISIKNINKSMGEGENVVFLHGIGGKLDNWTYQTKYISETNNVIALDLPGHGGSSGKGGMSVEEYADLLRPFFDLLELDDIVLVGHSLGGALALDFSSKYPERVKALVLAATSAKLDLPTQKLITLKNDIESIFGLDKTARKTSEAADEHVLTTDMRVLLGDLMAVKKFDATSFLSELKMPTLLIGGTDDKLVPVAHLEQLRSRIQYAQLRLINGAGHMMMLEVDQEFNTLLEEFLLDLLVNALYAEKPQHSVLSNEQPFPEIETSPTIEIPSTQVEAPPAFDYTQRLKQHKQASAGQAVDRFVEQFQPEYRHMVYYAALPLVLTPELVNYLRNQFLREEDVPWVAEVDLLLSDLCKQVGYELYAMDTAVRAYALAEMKRELGIGRMQQVAQLLLQYVDTQLWRNRPSISSHELKAQQWAAMVYLEDKREAAAQEMAQSLSDNVVSVRRSDGPSSAQHAELSHLSRLVDTLAPELERYPDLVDYARDVARILRDPAGLPAGRLNRKRTAAGVELPELHPLAQQPPTIEVTEEQPQEWQDPVTGMEFVWIQLGRFMMGQTEADKEYLIEAVGEEEYSKEGYAGYVNELPRHEVHIEQGFWMAKYPVTQAQWLKVMGKNPAYFNEERVGEAWRDHPVEQVSWDDVQEFLKTWNTAGEFRLPSEAEWEYACRAGAETMFCFGDDVELLKEYAWYSANSEDKTHPVGQLKPNEWGLYDMHGNVWEWCADPWHDSYEGAPKDGSMWQNKEEEKAKLLRGGSWVSDPQGCRCASRVRNHRDSRALNYGFRVVRRAVARTL